jgi:hypothetical protein
MARAAAAAAALWAIAIPFAAAPDYFPWFNALAGRHPERVLIDSDLDWGQDLLRLERELAARRVESVSIAYLGASNICRHALPRLTWLRPRQPTRGWIAISETFRHGIDGTYYRDDNPCDPHPAGRDVQARPGPVRLAGRLPAGGARRHVDPALRDQVAAAARRAITAGPTAAGCTRPRLRRRAAPRSSGGAIRCPRSRHRAPPPCGSSSRPTRPPARRGSR